MRRHLFWILLAPALAAASLISSDETGPGFRWDDAQVSATAGVGAASLTTVTIPGASAKILAMSSTGSDSLTLYAQMPHRWARTAVKPHCHIIPLYAPAADRTVRFTGQYAWADVNGALPAGGSWTTFDPVDVAVLTTDVLKHKLASIGSVAPSAAPGNSSVLVIHVVRDGASATDDYTDSGPSNLGILGCDVHFQSDTFGSVAEY